MSKSELKKVGIASLIMMASVFLSRLIGLFREMVIAYAAGASGDVDAYQVAFIIPEILNHIVASGFLSITFIPIFSKYLVNNNEKEGLHVFSIILTSIGTLLLVLLVFACMFAPALVSLLAPGLKDPILKASAVRMTRIIIPAQFLFFAGGLFSAVQFAKEKFFIPAIAPLIYNLGIISGGIFLGPILGIEGFAWGVLAGAFFGNFALQYYGAKKAGLNYRIAFDIFHPDFKKYILITLPLMLGITMTFSTEFFLKFFGSFLPRGSIAGLNYGLRIMFLLVGLFGQAVGTASFPYLARLTAENKIDEMNRLLNNTLKMLSLVMPLSAMLIALRHEVVFMLFQRGKFDASATELTSQVLIYLFAGAYAFSAQTIVARGYYAVSNTLFPAVFGTLAVFFSIPLYFLGMKVLGVKGVSIAISISAFLQVSLIYAVWNRQSKNAESKSLYRFILKTACLSIILGLILEALKYKIYAYFNPATFMGCLSVSAIVGLAFIFMLLALGYLFRVEEIKIITNKVVTYFRRYVSV